MKGLALTTAVFFGGIAALEALDDSYGVLFWVALGSFVINGLRWLTLQSPRRGG